MKKVLEFLEKYAQYLALGVSVIFLGLVAYSYVVAPDALKSKVGGKEVLPGEVDTTVATEVADRLLNNMGFARESVKQYDKRGPADVEKIPQPKPPAVSDEVKRALVVPNYKDKLDLAMGVKTMELTINYRPGVPAEDIAPPVVVENNKKLSLPKPSAPIAVRTASGHSFFQRPQDPAAAAAGGAAAGAVDGFDSPWITFVYKIDMRELADAWLKVFDPKDDKAMGAANTRFLYVEVEREELVGRDAQGREIWSNKTALKPVPKVLVDIPWAPNGDFKQPNDADGEKARSAEEEYLQWAEKHQTDIVLPPFYQCLAGDPWMDRVMGLADRAGDKEAAVVPVVEQQPFDPANPPNRPLTAQEKQQIYLYKKKLQEEEQKAKRPQNNPSPSPRPSRTPPRGGTGAANFLPPEVLAAEGPGADDTKGRGRAAGAAPARGGAAARPPVRPPVRPVPSDVRPDPNPEHNPSPRMYEGAAPGVTRDGTGAAGQLLQNPALATEFNPIALIDGAQGVGGNPPANLTGPVKEITGWVHDDTAQSNKIYRYRVRYYLKNPLYRELFLVAKPADAHKLWVLSDWSDWEAPAARGEVAPDVHYYFASEKVDMVSRRTVFVTVDVFRRSKGKWAKESFAVHPGDAIGQKKTDVDFSTGSTLVDLRSDVRDTRIVVADARGRLESRMLKAQQSDAVYKDLLHKVSTPKPEGAEGGPEGGHLNELAPPRRE